MHVSKDLINASAHRCFFYSSKIYVHTHITGAFNNWAITKVYFFIYYSSSFIRSLCTRLQVRSIIYNSWFTKIWSFTAWRIYYNQRSKPPQQVFTPISWCCMWSLLGGKTAIPIYHLYTSHSCGVVTYSHGVIRKSTGT